MRLDVYTFFIIFRLPLFAFPIEIQINIINETSLMKLV